MSVRAALVYEEDGKTEQLDVCAVGPRAVHIENERRVYREIAVIVITPMRVRSFR